MKFDTSLTAFKRWTPDHPDEIDWDLFLGKGLFILSISHEILLSVLNTNSIALQPNEILSDVHSRKWERLHLRIENGGVFSLPWARPDPAGRLVIVQGKHRFQYQLISGASEYSAL